MPPRITNPIRCVGAAMLIAAVAACNDDPLAADPGTPGTPALRNPVLVEFGLASFSPDGYLGIFAVPADPTLRFLPLDSVEVTIVSPTGDSVTTHLGPRYCQVAEWHFAVCHEYVMTLDTTVAFEETQRLLRDAGFPSNTLGSNRFVVSYDLLRRPTSLTHLTLMPGVVTAGHNSIGWLGHFTAEIAGSGLHGAVAITRESSTAADHVLSVPETGFVTVRYRQPDGSVLAQELRASPPA